MEIIIDDEDCDQVVDIICEHGRTGAVGDGKVFIMPVEEVVRIRTGDRGVLAV
jgi:nitrogen regulatory protein P-II 1